MWNPHLGEKLYIGTFPHLSWFHRPLPTLSHNCSISLQWLQLLLTCQILKRLWLSLNWRRCHCLVRQGPRAHCDPPLKPCFLPIIPKCTFLLILLGPVKKMGPNHYPLEVYFFSYIDIFLTFNRCDCIACLCPEDEWWSYDSPALGWGQDMDTNPFYFPRCAQNKSALPRLHGRESLYLSICPCCLDLRRWHQGGEI